MSPEEKARLNIDKQLENVGYVVQDMKDINLDVALGVVVREYPTSTGELDYLIFIKGKPVGVIEAKEENKGVELVVSTEKQTNRYANSVLKNFENTNVDLRFIYESTGTITRFTDYHDNNYCSREVFTFHAPEELEHLLRNVDTLRNCLIEDFLPLKENGFRKCQIKQ